MAKAYRHTEKVLQDNVDKLQAVRPGALLPPPVPSGGGGGGRGEGERERQRQCVCVGVGGVFTITILC